MEQIYAVINDGTVVNTIIADQSFVDQFYSGAILITGIIPSPGVGWLYVNGEFSQPQE